MCRVSIQRLIPFSIFLLSILETASSLILSGVVVDSSNSAKQISGVLVSVGHTQYRTVTDNQGRFSFDVPPSVNGTQKSVPFRSTRKVIYNAKSRAIDFSRVPDVKKIFYFNLRGALIYHADISIKNSVQSLPICSHGIGILKITLLNGTSFSYKLSTLCSQSEFAIPQYTSYKSNQSSQLSETVRLLFRHDDFFPVDTDIVSPSDSYCISMKPDPRHTVFDPGKINSYNFTIAPSDSIFMERNALKEQFVPADFKFNDSIIGKVGIRFKGSQYYLLKECFDSAGRLTNNSTCLKISLKIKFDKYNDSLRFYSLKRLNLHGMSDDPSKMHEMISYSLFREMGVYASKTSYIKVTINGKFWGVFLAVEELDGRFTKSRWPQAGDGNLYKELWISYHTQSEIDTALVTNDAPEDSADLKRMWNFGRAIKTLTAANFKSSISPFMDLNYWLRYITVDRAIHNSDGIMTWYYDTASGWAGNHNFYIYEDESPERKFWLIPWDLPATLTRNDMIIDDFGVPEWNVKPQRCDTAYAIWNNCFARPPNCDAFTGTTAELMWPDFVTIGEQFLNSCFTAERLQSTVDTLFALLSPAIEKDPTLNFDNWKNDVDYLRASMPILTSGYGDYLHGSSTPGESLTPGPTKK